MQKYLNYTFIALDIIMPVLYATTFDILNKDFDNTVPDPKEPPTGILTVYLISSYTKGILLLISACFLADSIIRIRRVIAKTDSAAKLNQTSFISHLILLTLYISSTFLFYIAFTIGNVKV